MKEINLKGGHKISVELIKMLILAAGGELLSQTQLKKPTTTDKTRIRIHNVSQLSRTEIDERLSEAPSQESDVPKVSEDPLLVDYHWIFDCIYSQKLKPIRIYLVQ